jgi:hypothetical protein
MISSKSFWKTALECKKRFDKFPSWMKRIDISAHAYSTGEFIKNKSGKR